MTALVSNPLLWVHYLRILGRAHSGCQKRVRTSRRALVLARGKVALVSVLMDGEPDGGLPLRLLNRKSTLDEVIA